VLLITLHIELLLLLLKIPPEKYAPSIPQCQTFGRYLKYTSVEESDLPQVPPALGPEGVPKNQYLLSNEKNSQ
jgi:hypothetical protein